MSIASLLCCLRYKSQAQLGLVWGPVTCNPSRPDGKPAFGSSVVFLKATRRWCTPSSAPLGFCSWVDCPLRTAQSRTEVQEGTGISQGLRAAGSERECVRTALQFFSSIPTGQQALDSAGERSVCPAGQGLGWSLRQPPGPFCLNIVFKLRESGSQEIHPVSIRSPGHKGFCPNGSPLNISWHWVSGRQVSACTILGVPDFP